jgi:DNA-binding transcriptional regulator YiaG
MTLLKNAEEVTERRVERSIGKHLLATGVITAMIFGTSSTPTTAPVISMVRSTGWGGMQGQATSSRAVQLTVSASSTGTLPKSTNPQRTASQLVKDFHERSGLTWDQVARMFGVSRRSVHMWVAGGKMSSANQEYLAELSRQLDLLPGTGPAERKLQILHSEGGQSSMFSQALSRHASKDDDINRPAGPRPYGSSI